jgi:hypothetical protein
MVERSAECVPIIDPVDSDAGFHVAGCNENRQRELMGKLACPPTFKTVTVTVTVTANGINIFIRIGHGDESQVETLLLLVSAVSRSRISHC